MAMSHLICLFRCVRFSVFVLTSPIWIWPRLMWQILHLTGRCVSVYVCISLSLSIYILTYIHILFFQKGICFSFFNHTEFSMLLFFLWCSWTSLGACLSLEHLDLSGCEKITDHTLRKLSVGLGDLTASTKHSDRRTKHTKGSPIPITLMEEESLGSVERKRHAIIFKQGPGRWGGARTQTQVWVLDSLDLADIEDAVEQSRCDGMPFSEAKTFVETQLVGGLCCCRRSRRRRHRTSSNAAFLQQHYAMSGEMFCGHSTCCTSDTALRTFTGPQSGSDTLRSSTAEFRTKGPSFGHLQCIGHETRTEQSDVKRSLRFLSLSGCYQITDMGLR